MHCFWTVFFDVSPAASSNLIIFVLFYHIVTFSFFIFVYYIFACSTYKCFYWIGWLYSFIIISPHCNLINIFSKYIMFLSSKFSLSSWYYSFVFNSLFHYQVDWLLGNFMTFKCKFSLYYALFCARFFLFQQHHLLCFCSLRSKLCHYFST